MRRCIVALLIAASLLIATGDWASAETPEQARIRELQVRISKLQAEQDRIRGDLTATQEQRQTLQREIQLLLGQIKLVENQIAATDEKIELTTEEMGLVQTRIVETRADMSRKRETVGRMILYLEQRDREHIVESMLKFANLSSFLTQFHDLSNVQTRLVALIGDLKSDKTELESQQVQLTEKQGDLEELLDEAEVRRNELSGVKSERTRVLTVTKGQETEYQKMLTENERLQRETNLEIFKIEEELRRRLDPNSLPLAGRGILSWPMAAAGTKTQPYGCVMTNFAIRNYPDCNGGKGGFHNGYDVAAPYGTKLLAADSGKVVAAGSAPRAYGIWLVVEHPNGLYTAYTHMSQRDVQVGQTVTRGSVVGRMGSTGLSTGSHLHFMVYAPKSFSVQQSAISGTLPVGATLNPADYL